MSTNTSFCAWFTTKASETLPTDLLESLYKLSSGALQNLMTVRAEQSQPTGGEENDSTRWSFGDGSMGNVLVSSKLPILRNFAQEVTSFKLW